MDLDLPYSLELSRAHNLLDRGGAKDVLGVAEDLALSLKGRCLNLLVLVVCLLACSLLVLSKE